jgi:pSer/pThr/pTyr-binding forkhead associated (FHA) protein
MDHFRTEITVLLDLANEVRYHSNAIIGKRLRMAKLKIIITNKIVEYHEIKGRTVLGRGKIADILLLDPSISREHSIVHAEGEAFFIEDNGSANGTYVNDQRISKVELMEGDLIRLGTKLIIFTREDFRPNPELEVDLFQKPLSEFPEQKVLDALDVQFVIPSTEDKLEGIYALTRKMFQGSSLSDDEADSLHTALREAIGNGIRHGNKFDEHLAIRFRCLRDPDKVVCSIEDDGPGFDYITALERGRKGDAISAARERYLAGGMGGLGIMLMVRCVDLVEYNDKGNRVILTKCRGDFFKDETIIGGLDTGDYVDPPTKTE